MKPPVCPYCGERTRLVTGAVMYPRRDDLHDRRFWVCGPCDAYVGCHRGTSTPLGSLANGRLRRARRAAHAAFDPVWQQGTLPRGEAYRWLAEAMGLSPSQTHIGRFNEQQCAQVIALCAGPAWSAAS
jgi:hypothetical protein